MVIVPRWKNVLQTSDEVYRIKRAAVLREATRIIGRRGYHNTSLDDIAEALQVSKGTLYNYVTDKQEILFECHRMSLDIGDQAFTFADEHGTSGYGKLRLMLRAYLTWLNGAMGAAGVASDVTALRPEDRKAIIVRRDSVQDRMVGYFEEGFKDGTIRQIDARVAVYTLMGAVNSVQMWYSPRGRLSLDAIVASVTDVLLHGVDTDADAGYVDEPVPPYDAAAAPPRTDNSKMRRKPSVRQRPVGTSGDRLAARQRKASSADV
jgi:AcrR family transcriptional regulator